MKTAISIPDDVFESAERVARDQGLSRSALYAKALRRYVADCESDPVTEQLNRIYGSRSAVVDPIIAEIAFRSLPKEEW